MLKIRLMRIGAKKKPFYRVVIVDERNKRTGGYIENVGTYNPLTTPKEIKLQKDRIDHWLKMGAQKSDGFLRILGEAPQRPPRKPKKEAKTAPQAAAAPVEAQPKPAEEPVSEPAIQSEPVEEAKVESVDQIRSDKSEAGEPVNQKETTDAPTNGSTDTQISSDLSGTEEAAKTEEPAIKENPEK